VKRLLSILLFILGSVFYSSQLLDTRPTSFADGKTLILYDAASGNIPDSSLLPFTAFPPDAASLEFTDGASILDTTISGKDAYAGWIASPGTTAGMPILDRSTGIQVNFSLQVESEMHTSKNRSGFSVIILDQEAKGIELAFWENEIWAQNDDQTGGLFKHGEGVPFQTHAGLTDYQLTIIGETYTLAANSQQILSGPIRDYSKFDGFPDPYESPNFLFLGDDTTSSQARLRLRFLSVTGTEPSVPTTASTNTSISTPPPTASFTPLPSATALPVPTTRAPGFEFCSSGWLLTAMIIAYVIISKTIKR
jgi:hypothetical protein